MTTQTTKDFDELRAKVEVELAKKVKPRSCANCRYSIVECSIPRGIDAEHAESIGLRCDSWELAE